MLWQFDISLGAYQRREEDFKDDKRQAHQIASIWALWIILSIVFLMLTGGLCIYHTFLICTAQTTWEHTRRDQITYLKPYQRSLLPFYLSIK
mmetsp:Transcript_11359/g.19147  ORF Transcript_11359/g.19147 Transcript_11359/m.19147 type:complete len:92 (+) Transcript_11359:335-610(+)